MHVTSEFISSVTISNETGAFRIGVSKNESIGFIVYNNFNEMIELSDVVKIKCLQCEKMIVVEKHCPGCRASSGRSYHK